MILATVQRIFPALCRGVTLGNVACNLSRNGATKLRDKLQEKLPSVTEPLTFTKPWISTLNNHPHITSKYNRKMPLSVFLEEQIIPFVFPVLS